MAHTRTAVAQTVGSESAASKESTLRFYVVEDTQTKAVLIVEAGSASSALRRVVQPRYSVRAAAPSDMLLAVPGHGDAKVLRIGASAGDGAEA